MAKIEKKKSAFDHRLEFAKFVILINQGKTKEEIIESLGLTQISFENLFSKYYSEAEADHQSKTPLRIFAEAVGRKQQLIRDLEGLKEFLQSKNYKNAQAYVAAVKTQSDMMDSLVKLGQDLGLIEKSPDQVLFVGGKDVRELDKEEIESAIFEKINNIQNLMAKRGTTGKKRTGNLVSFPNLEEQRKSQ